MSEPHHALPKALREFYARERALTRIKRVKNFSGTTNAVFHVVVADDTYKTGLRRDVWTDCYYGPEDHRNGWKRESLPWKE